MGMFSWLWKELVGDDPEPDPVPVKHKDDPAKHKELEDLFRPMPDGQSLDPRRPSRPMVEKLTDYTDIRIHLMRSVNEMAMSYAIPWISTLSDSEKEELFFKHSISEKAANEILFRSYSRIYSASEIMDMIAFFKTRTGQKMVKTSGMVAREVCSDAHEKAGQIAMRIIKDGIRRDMDS